MRSASRIVSALAVLAVVGCTGEPKPPEAPAAQQGARRADPAPEFPAFAIRGLESRSVLEVPPAEMRAAIASAYRVGPDRRFLGAVAEAHRLMSGLALDTVTATFTEGAWTIEYAGERVGFLPELPGFEDARRLLVGWAARLLLRYPLASDASPVDEDLARARDLLAQARPVEIVSGLMLLDDGWSRTRRREWLPPAAEGLSLLAMQVSPLEVVGDPIAARALAVSALAQAAGVADSVAPAVVLLADHMGYSTEARTLGAWLPGAAEAARLYVRRDVAALSDAAGPLARFLYLADLTRGGGNERWNEWRSGVASESAGDPGRGERVDTSKVTSGALGRALDFASFDSDEALTPLVAGRLLAELRALAALRPRTMQVAGDWGDVLGAEDGRAKRLGRFETDIAAVAGQIRGSFLDSALTRSYFRAQLHHAFERSCIHQVDGRESANDALALAMDFTSSAERLWSESGRWCSHLARALGGQPAGERAIADIRVAVSASRRARDRALEDVAKGFKFNGVVELDAARAIFSRLDSRPADLYEAGEVARNVLYDLPLADRYDARVVALAARDYESLAVSHAFRVGDVRALQRMAADTSRPREMRLEALVRLAERDVDSAAVDALFRRLVAEPNAPWSLRAGYIERVLEPARRFDDAARVAREWMDAHPRTPAWVHSASVMTLARLYQSLGRTREAWDLVSPLIGSNDLEDLRRAALIALDLRDVATAGRLARTAVDRYPRSADARVALAQVRWALGDDTSAAQAIASKGSELGISAWTETVAPTFVRAFAKRPVADAVRAVAALTAAGIDELTLATIPRAAAKAGELGLAASLGETLAKTGNPRLFYPEVYRYVKAARGDSAAFAWIAARWPPPQSLLYALDAYRLGAYDILWTITTIPGPGDDEGSFLWLLRALGELQEPTPRPERRRELQRRHQSVRSGPYDVAGRFLMGLEPEEKLIALADTPKRRVEYAYYIGIKALSEGRYRDASDWLRVAVETRQTDDGEFLWAKELLGAWQETGKALPDAAKEVAGPDPRASRK